MKKKIRFGLKGFRKETPKIAKAFGAALIALGGGESIHALFTQDVPTWYVVTVISATIIGRVLLELFYTEEKPENDENQRQDS